MQVALSLSWSRAACQPIGESMAIRTDGQAVCPAWPSTNCNLRTGRANPTTTPSQNPQLSIARRCDRCEREAPRLCRYVERLGGGGTDCCLRCLRWLVGEPVPTPTAAQESARSRWRSL